MGSLDPAWVQLLSESWIDGWKSSLLLPALLSKLYIFARETESTKPIQANIMDLTSSLSEHLSEAFKAVFELEVSPSDIQLTPTRKEFEGHYTFVTFNFTKPLKQNPDAIAQALGEYLKEHSSSVADFNVVKGFLNMVVDSSVWVKALAAMQSSPAFRNTNSNGKRVMVEYSSPNTNKPLHLGHLRNNFLGHSLCRILRAAGYEVTAANLVNDRGIHICKSMLAYQKFGNGETPETADIKGDKMVGNYYVEFDKAYKAEVAELTKKYQEESEELSGYEDIKDRLKELQKKGGKKKEALTAEEKEEIKLIKELLEKAEKEAPLLKEAQEMLRKWEEGNTETVELWKTMNGWVFDGFDQTYTRMGVEFDQFYYESETYLLGKDIIEEGLEKEVFFKKPNGSVWIDLKEDKLDEKLVLRSDGTSVYMTQDIGTCDLKYKDHPMELSVYVVGNEQEYHFKVLKKIMQKLERPYADGIYHLSYGMVDLPSGKMKSREGTVVDADDLMDEMVNTARERTASLGKIDDFSKEEAKKLYEDLALGALKYYLLRVDPIKRMLFNPEESIDFQGNTGVYIQYTHAKISAILRKAEHDGIVYESDEYVGLQELEAVEADVIAMLLTYRDKIAEAAASYAPSIIANFSYELSKMYSKFYSELSIFGEEDPAKRAFRIALSDQVARILRKTLFLLGINAPERM